MSACHRCFSHRLLLFAASLWLVTPTASTVHAANRWVGHGGKDSGAATTKGKRWKTITYAVKNLQPGDTLTIVNGVYNLRTEGARNGHARIKRKHGGEIDGWTNRWTTIRAERTLGVRIIGNLESRGSFIRIKGLHVVGDRRNEYPGLYFRNAHHIDVFDCEVERAGGGGISFVQSDCIEVRNNSVHDNATLNPDQHSGISVYQPIRVNDPEGQYWPIRILRNNCYDNENIIPHPRHGWTDGNGIILDDYNYTQLGNRPNLPSRYTGRTLVEGNACTYNGGSGIHVFHSGRVTIKNNTCIGNGQSIRRNNGDYRNRGQISLEFARDCHVLNNVMQSTFVGAASQNAPYAATERNGSSNTWELNLLHSRVRNSDLWNNANIDHRAIYADPRFVNAAAFDYRTRTGRQRGKAWARHTYVSRNGITTRANRKPDLGAYEFAP